jgi:hypothetical protein
MRTTTINITPSIAANLLAVNDGNRKLRNKTVGYFANCLRERSFHLTHQGISIQGTLGNPIRLFDGQHRLAAIMATGIPAAMQVSENCSEHCFRNADNGLPRNLADRTGLTGSDVSIARCVFEISQRTKTVLKTSPDRLCLIHSIITEDLSCVLNQHKRGLSSASFMLAFTLQQHVFGENLGAMFQSGESDHNEELIKKNPCLFSLKVRLSQAAGRRQAFRQCESFWLIWQAITSPNKARAMVAPNSVDLAANALRKHWPEVYEAASV